LRAARQRAAVYEVEIQKKLAISAACVISRCSACRSRFATRGGGVGLVIGTSLAGLLVYYVGLIGGENWAIASSCRHSSRCGRRI